MIFNSWAFSRAWLSVAVGQGSDKDRPALYRATLIEEFDAGVRLVSTDGYVLLRAWISSAAADGSSDPGLDAVPELTVVCSDRDRRINSLMGYVQGVTKGDGIDTPLQLSVVLGTMKTAGQDQLEGMEESTVAFHFGHEYDERIESPIFDGNFPAWKPLWFDHETRTTERVTFGANALQRIGKLSALWDKAAVRFEMGGEHGVAKFYVAAPDVNVEGLSMPFRESGNGPVPPSEEGVHSEYADELDQFLADVLKAEVVTADDSAIGTAKRAQLVRAANVVVEAGFGDVTLLVERLAVSEDRAEELLIALIEIGVLEDLGNDKLVTTSTAAEVIAQYALNDEGEDPEPP